MGFEPLLSVEGDGPPVLLVPGLDGTGLLFYRQVPSLARRYRVGTCRLRDDAQRIETLLADVETARRAVASHARVTLLAESFGGAVAMSYALAHPDRVERLVVLNSFPYFTARARLAAGYHLLRAVPWGAMSILRRVTARRMHSPHTSAAELQEFHRRMRVTTRQGYLSRLAMIRDYDLRPHLPRLTTPTLFLAADGDRLLPAVEHARLMASQAPNATLRILEGHGHTCLIAPGLDLATILDEWRIP